MEESDRMAILLDRASICLDRNNLKAELPWLIKPRSLPTTRAGPSISGRPFNVDIQEVFFERKNEPCRLKNQNGNPGRWVAVLVSNNRSESGELANRCAGVFRCFSEAPLIPRWFHNCSGPAGFSIECSPARARWRVLAATSTAHGRCRCHHSKPRRENSAHRSDEIPI